MFFHTLYRNLDGDKYEFFVSPLQLYKKQKRKNDENGFVKQCKTFLATYCFPSPSLQFGQVQATRRKRGLAGLALLAAGVDDSEAITTSIVPSAPGVGDDNCPPDVVGAEATVTSWN